MNLKERTSGLNEGERLFEYKSLNRHAAVFHLDLRHATYAVTPQSIRNRVKELTRPNLLRGVAFGVHVQSQTIPDQVDDYLAAIDIRQKERAVWQWTILQIEDPKQAVGLHTWMRVGLSDMFDDYLNRLDSDYPIKKFVREKGKLFKIASALGASDLPDYE